MQTSRSFNTASSSSLRYLHGPPPLPLPTQSSSCSTAPTSPIPETSTKPADHALSVLPSSSSFVRSQAASFERRIRHHTKSLESKKPAFVPPVPPLPSSSTHLRSPCSPRTINVSSYGEQAAVLTSSPTPMKQSTDSALPTRKSTVRKKPAPPVSPSLHAELYKTPKAKKSSPLPVPWAPSRALPPRDEVWGINSSTLSLGLGIRFDEDNNERAYVLGQEDEPTGTDSRVPDTQEPADSPPRAGHVDNVERSSTPPNAAVLVQDEKANAEPLPASGRSTTPLPSTTSDSYDLALLEVDRAFHARIELSLREPGAATESGAVERPIRRGASSITLGRARSLRQTSLRAAETSTRSASLNVPSRSSPAVSQWLTNTQACAESREIGVQRATGDEVDDPPPITSSNDGAVRRPPTSSVESTRRWEESRPTPALTRTRTSSLASPSLFRNKSLSALKRTLSRSRTSQKQQPDCGLPVEKDPPPMPEATMADGGTTPKGVETPKRRATLKRLRPQQKQWWEHTIVVVGAAGPGAFY
ncbi:hypothetical protein BCV69DRAFT_122414 [Microstroma glucosiphilum]|uniref:Uncharacterized protein n=1 Tax=Pseudomicrostroma glucosiphilum TaxID=1684307 RepID=A0A316U4E8_9BASI|nr:hypothetical protein BCV69DRAFT_122414 [Pseudomicrostroma glucosiphilum]PWN17795.1 hypothetical protein BCV69DRAFT_122414 [Pseudomicrostroma glucosiphilum]